MKNKHGYLYAEEVLRNADIVRPACRDILNTPIYSMHKQRGFNGYTYKINEEKIVKFAFDRPSLIRLKREEFISRFIHDRLPVQTTKVTCGQINIKVKNSEKLFHYAVSDVIEGCDITPEIHHVISDGFYRQLAEIMAALHQIKVPSNPYISSRKRNMADILKICYEQVTGESFAGVPLSFRQKMLNRVYSENFMAGKEVLCHGDIAFDNLRIDEKGKIQGIIDFGETCKSVPSYEFFRMSYDMNKSDVEKCMKHYNYLMGDQIVTSQMIFKNPYRYEQCKSIVETYRDEIHSALAAGHKGGRVHE